jgi:hypothetical protein
VFRLQVRECNNGTVAGWHTSSGTKRIWSQYYVGRILFVIVTDLKENRKWIKQTPKWRAWKVFPPKRKQKKIRTKLYLLPGGRTKISNNIRT